MDGPGFRATVILGDLDGAASPGTVFTPIVGADIVLDDGADVRLPVDPDFEYAALTMSGVTEVDGMRVEPGSMLYLGSGRRELPLRADGERFPAARRRAVRGEARHVVELRRPDGRGDRPAREDWMTGDRFGTVRGYDGAPIPAPVMPATPSSRAVAPAELICGRNS